MTQEEVFELVYVKYSDSFPGMLHGSGGLPDTIGEGTSDVDICVYSEKHDALQDHFPADTIIDRSKSSRTIYTLTGYEREVNIYCSNTEHWNNGALHRKTELALNMQYPSLSKIAFALKRAFRLSTEQTWAKVLQLGDDFSEVLLDTSKVLQVASHVDAELDNLQKRLPKA